jgi:hypothetical protein
MRWRAEVRSRQCRGALKTPRCVHDTFPHFWRMPTLIYVVSESTALLHFQSLMQRKSLVLRATCIHEVHQYFCNLVVVKNMNLKGRQKLGAYKMQINDVITSNYTVELSCIAYCVCCVNTNMYRRGLKGQFNSSRTNGDGSHQGRDTEITPKI